MATRSEKFHAEEQRKAQKKPVSVKRTKPGVAPKNRTRAKKHAGRKATYALEPVMKGARPTRKSSRKSANRSKPDTTLNLIEGLKKGSPEQTFRKSQARATRTRGKTTGR